jgi:lipoyl(octanoyl) transferase
MDLKVEWLGRMDYRPAWDVQRARHASRAEGEIPDTLLLVEHEAVLTLGRHARDEHVISPADELARRGIDVIRVERGGEVTYHGPGQLVAYPIVRLRERPVLLRPFVRALELAMADVAARYEVAAAPRPGYPGVWVGLEGPHPRKLGALGLRVERGVTYHGIALNVTTRLDDFELIDPCGMAGLDVTSIAREREWDGPAADASTDLVEQVGAEFAADFARRLAAATDDAAERRMGQPAVAGI